MKNLFLTISIIASFLGPVIGIISILKGSFRPQRMTRFLIVVVLTLFVGTLYFQNDRNSIYLALAQLLGNIVLFVLTLKKGIGGTTRMDITVFIMATITLLIWQTTNNPKIGLAMSILTDFIGFTPTLLKAWTQPRTEEWRFYMADVIAGLTSAFSVKNISVWTLLLPVYIFIINIISVGIIILRRRSTNR